MRRQWKRSAKMYAFICSVFNRNTIHLSRESGKIGHLAGNDDEILVELG